MKKLVKKFCTLRTFVVIWASCLFLFYNAPNSYAHFLSQSDSDLIISNNTVTWRHRVHKDDFLTKYKDVPETVIKEHLNKNLKLYFDTTECMLRNTQFFDDAKSQTVYFMLSYNCPLKFNEVRVLYDQFYASPTHRHILKLNYENRLQTFAFSPNQTEFFWKRPSTQKSFQEYYKMVKQFLEKGYNGYIALGAVIIIVVGLFKLLRRKKEINVGAR